jgi:hypothetical protein
MKAEIKEMASDNVLLSAYMILQEAKDLKRSLALELDMVRDRRLAQEKEFQEFMAELRDTLTKIQAQFKIEAQLLNLVRPQVGEKECQKGKGANHSGQNHSLKGFVQKTR